MGNTRGFKITYFAIILLLPISWASGASLYYQDSIIPDHKSLGFRDELYQEKQDAMRLFKLLSKKEQQRGTSFRESAAVVDSNNPAINEIFEIRSEELSQPIIVQQSAPETLESSSSTVPQSLQLQFPIERKSSSSSEWQGDIGRAYPVFSPVGRDSLHYTSEYDKNAARYSHSILDGFDSGYY